MSFFTNTKKVDAVDHRMRSYLNFLIVLSENSVKDTLGSIFKSFQLFAPGDTIQSSVLSSISPVKEGSLEM